MNRLDITNENDRLTVATILIKNDYIVAQGKERVGNKTVKYLEYKERNNERKRS